MDKLIIKLPFPGFYCSTYSEELDRTEEQEAENIAEEKSIPAGKIAECFYWSTDYRKAFEHIAKEYVDYFGEYIEHEFEIALGLEFESMQSPKEYNFATDRIFAYIPADKVDELFAMVDRENLAAVIKERFTSCSGFISFYSNDVDDWLEKPIKEWDHNQTETLLLALLKSVDDDWEYFIFCRMVENDPFYTAFDKAVDWKKFEEKVDEMKAENEEE